MILAPLRGVTTRCFRETFAKEIAEAGFDEAVTPFISIAPGVDPLKDREIRASSFVPRASCVESQGSNHEARGANNEARITPQFIGKDPESMRAALERVKSAGFAHADLNCGCPFPMVRNKGRGSGLLRTPDVLRKLLEVGCETMGDGNFSIKTRLGVDRPDELLKLMSLINCFPLRRIVVHARTARQMYEGEPDREAFDAIVRIAKMPVIYNGDAPLPTPNSQLSTPNSQLSTPNSQLSTLHSQLSTLMVGRAFIRRLGERDDAADLLKRYIAASLEELGTGRPVVGRIKELVAYWKEIPRWRRLWPVVKIARSLDELTIAIG